MGETDNTNNESTLQQEAPPQWMGDLTEREIKEVKLAVHYLRNFNHGTTGHNQLVLIAKLAFKLDLQEQRNKGPLHFASTVDPV